MGRAYGTHGRKERFIQGLVERPAGKRPLGRPCHKGNDILKWVLNKWYWEAWTGMIWREWVSFPGRTVLRRVISDSVRTFGDLWLMNVSNLVAAFCVHIPTLCEQWVELNFPCLSMTSYGSRCSPSLYNTEISFLVPCLCAEVWGGMWLFSMVSTV